jgi:hypothetical protein
MVRPERFELPTPCFVGKSAPGGSRPAPPFAAVFPYPYINSGYLLSLSALPLSFQFFRLLTHFLHTLGSSGPPPDDRESRLRACGSLTPIRSILPTIGLTRHRLKKLDAICLVRQDRADRKQDLAYQARPFVLCGIPLRRPAQNQLTHARRNGNFSLEIIAHPRFGLPFGQDRLIPLWVATLAVLQRSRTVRFRNPSQLLDYFEMPKNGFHFRRIAQGFQRVFGATIFFGTDDQRPRAAVTDSARFHFFDRLQLWYNRDDALAVAPGEGFANVITLSEAFYGEIDQHKIPAERKVVAALANAPGTLDLYIWLSWRSWTLAPGHIARIPLFGQNGLCAQLGSIDYARPRRFREKLAQWLREVNAWWPDCPAEMSHDGKALRIASARRSPAINPATRPLCDTAANL